MKPIQISGKLFNASMHKVEGIQLYKGGNDDTATIELTSPKIEDIKTGDVLLMKVRVYAMLDKGEPAIDFIDGKIKDIVAILPHPKTCACEKPDPFSNLNRDNCGICNKPLPIKPQECNHDWRYREQYTGEGCFKGTLICMICKAEKPQEQFIAPLLIVTAIYLQKCRH